MAGVQVTHNGMVLAEVVGGQSAVLKCSGKKMSGDVVVAVPKSEQTSGGGHDVTIAPLIVVENGVYGANSPGIITEVWDGSEDFTDATVNFYDITLPYAKSKKLVASNATHLLLKDPSCTVAFDGTLNGEDISFSVPISEMDLRANDEDGVTVFFEGVPILLWLHDAYAAFTDDFEDDSVYVLNLWALGAVGTLTITAPGKASVDGFMPVKVNLPINNNPAVIEPHAFDFDMESHFDEYHKAVKVKAVRTQELTVYPATEDVTYTSDWGKFYKSVTVKANDISNMKLLCGIYLDPIPKTEYKLGELHDVSGSYVVRMYTNGETVRVNLLSIDVDGWDKVTSPGTYTLTVTYSESGITSKTAYKINVTAP